jgi:hypothetical protein
MTCTLNNLATLLGWIWHWLLCAQPSDIYQTPNQEAQVTSQSVGQVLCVKLHPTAQGSKPRICHVLWSIAVAGVNAPTGLHYEMRLP